MKGMVVKNMPKKVSGGIAATVRTIAEPIATRLGLRIWDVEYVKEGARYVLRITIDSDDGITIEDCETFHRAIDPALDEADPIEDAYTLEVSSPGVERELKNEEMILACIGWDVEARLFAPIDGAKSFAGKLLALNEDGSVTIGTDSGEISISRDKIAKIQTVYDFG